MKKFNLFFATAILAAFSTSVFAAGTVTYRMSIDGNFATTQPFLSAGTHTLVVQAQVTGNDLTGGGVHGGIFQSAFNLNTNNAGFSFVDATGGFIGAPNAAWDSTNFIPPFDTHNNGVTTLTSGGGPNIGGGPFIVAETSGISPTNFNTKFGDVGANVFTTVAQGNFTFAGGTHPTALNLVVANPLGGDIVVAALSGGNIVGSAPTSVLNATINFMDIGGNTDPNVVSDTGGTRPNRNFMHQFVATDTEEPNGPFDWSVAFTSGPTTPAGGTFSINPTTGLFSWNVGNVPGGFDKIYVFTATAMDSGDLSGTGTITVRLPEPGAFVLAGMSLIGVASSRRRNRQLS